MSFKFEKLIIWQKAMDYGEEINTLAEGFPKKEIYNLSSQICRAADSVALNISEGSILQSKQKTQNFLAIQYALSQKPFVALLKPNEENILTT
jgi:formate dehydrogenase maturation protein FdhE